MLKLSPRLLHRVSKATYERIKTGSINLGQIKKNNFNIIPVSFVLLLVSVFVYSKC